jgi:hypothetical protein
MYRLSGINGVFGFKHRTSEQAERAKDDYIKDFARGRASLIQRKYESGNMRLLESEAIDMAIEELKRGNNHSRSLIDTILASAVALESI